MFILAILFFPSLILCINFMTGHFSKLSFLIAFSSFTWVFWINLKIGIVSVFLSNTNAFYYFPLSNAGAHNPNILLNYSENSEHIFFI